MSRLNYSKWDQLELSDDSDIEGHPNVDKRSLIRWKQRDIHEKREMRKAKIAKLEAEIACNGVLRPRIAELVAKLPTASPSSAAYLNSLAEQLEKNPSPDAPPTGVPGQPTYDAMLLSLIVQVSKAAKDKVGDGAGMTEVERDERLGKALVEEISGHLTRLDGTTKELQTELETEIKEQHKHITSDDIHEGFESKYIPAKPEPPAVTISSGDSKKKQKATTTEFEVLNPQASTSTSAPADQAADDDDEEAELPELTPSLEGFSKIKLQEYERSFEFLQAHRDIFVPGASDALLVAAFRAQSAGKSTYAKQCVNQSLLLQYCEKLGRDGPSVFFRKMISGEKRALKVFEDDVESTYNHLCTRVKISQEEANEAAGKEQIQLVAEDPNQTITFNVPDGPPPENLVLEGPGTEGLDIEEVRKALQFKWDVFEGFPTALKEALKGGSLDAVNKVLGDMEVPDAEMVVQSLDMAGILSFAESGVRDETGKGA